MLTSSGDTVDTLTYVYDNFGRVVETKDANNNSVYYTYDTQNQLVEQKDQNGSVEKYYYTPHGIKYRTDKLVDTIDNVDYYSKTISGYDAYGNIVQTKQTSNKPGDPETYSISKYSYDNVNRLIKTEDVIDSTHSRFSQYCYDNGGRLTKAFTGLKAPLTITDAHYTANGDNQFSVAAYEYDAFGNQTKYTDPLGKSETYEYSFSNLLNKKTLRNGTTVNYTYDAMGRCIKAVAGDKTIHYSYNGLGQLTAVEDELGTTTYAYDLLNRLTSEARDDTDNKRDYNAQYQYSGTGITDFKLSTRNHNSGDFQTSIHETFTYNNLKQLSQLTHSDTAAPEEILTASYTYGKAGELLHKQVSGASMNQNIAYTYNKAGLNTKITNVNTLADGITADYPNEVSFTENYTYNLSGNLIEKFSQQKAIKNTEIQSQENNQANYTYDALNRLTKEQYSETKNGGAAVTWQNAYTFDENDNRLSKTYQKGQSSVTTSYQYDAANKLTAETATDGRHFTYAYDQNGSLLTKSSINQAGASQTLETYAYDSFNRLSSVQKNNETYSYLYDGNDRRIQKNSPDSQLQEFWFNGKIAFEDLQETNSGNTKQSYHAYTFDNGLLAVSSEGSLTNLSVVDAHGDTVKLLSAETPFDAKYQYDAFGNQASESTPSVYNPYQYNGKYLDSETGFYYLNARYYNPEVGRFMQEDTYQGQISNASTLNLYNYCGSNPIAYEDETGHFWETVFDIASLAWSAYDFIKKPNLWNGICLAWDIAAVVVPCIPGSYVAKGIKAASKGVKAVVKTVKPLAKAVTKTNKIFNAIDTAYDTTKTIKRIKQTLKTVETAAEKYARKQKEIKQTVTKTVDALVKSFDTAALTRGKKFSEEAVEQLSKKSVQSTSSVLSQGAKTSHVYFGVKNGERTYVGISTDVARREVQHGARFDRLEPITKAALTRKEARAIEQVLIEHNPQFTNKINSIAKSRSWYDEAIKWGSEWVENNLK